MVINSQVMIQFAGQEIPKSPFKVMVEGAPGDPSQVTAAGPGLEPYGVQAGKKTYFEVYTEGKFCDRVTYFLTGLIL